MLREARGRAYSQRSGAMRIYVPKDLVQSVIFPFKEKIKLREPFDILIRVDPENKRLIIEKYSK